MPMLQHSHPFYRVAYLARITMLKSDDMIVYEVIDVDCPFASIIHQSIFHQQLLRKVVRNITTY